VRFIDTHCHLNHEHFAADLHDVLARAAEAGVERMVVVGFDLASSEAAVRLVREHPALTAAVGIHPHDARHYGPEAEVRLRELAADPSVAAIGETGLDFHYDFSPRDAQRRALLAQLALARERDLPVVFHCREAYPELLDVLESQGRRVAGVMHCWAGSCREAERALALGLYLGFGGALTFKNAEETRAVAAAAPLERLLLETDAPYLAPVPHRGRRCEPAHLRLTAEKLAEIRGVPLADLADATTANALRLFALPG